MSAHATLGQHLRRINRMGLVVALTVVGVFVLVGSYVTSVLMLTATHTSMARMLAETATAAIAFDDRLAARELLQALRNTPEIRGAAIYRGDGALFASYARAGATVPAWVRPGAQDAGVLTDHVLVSERVQAPPNAGAPTGAVLVLDVGLDALHARVIWQVLAIAGVGMLALLLSELLLRGLHERLLQPMNALTRLMRRVSDEADYGVRAQPSDVEELTVLADGFNVMLVQIAERDASLQHARRLAEQASKAKGEFLATMSHEIRTPLNGVLGMTELLMGSDITPRQRAWATAARSSGTHLLAIINDILDFSKIEAGQLLLESADFDLLETVEDALAMFAEQAERKGVELAATFGHAAAGTRMRGDALRIRQVIVNLVSNAVKFTEAGAISVSVTIDDAATPARQVSVVVHDTGVGIPAEAQARIFEQFSQADGSTTRRFGGTGLGLAICTRIVRQMGGDITVDSAPGQGSTFRVTFPFVPPTAVQARSAMSLAGTHVLVVDADGGRRGSIVSALHAAGAEPTVVADGAGALALLTGRARAGAAFDVLLVHRTLADGNGLALARSARATLGSAAPPVVLIDSNYAGASADEMAAAAIACSIGKPVRRDELLRAVAAARDMWRDMAIGTQGAAAAAGSRASVSAHVLLAEDNLVNQEVARAMLEILGARVTVVNDGAAAVDRVHQGDIDLVLMDCQMPTLDGYEATRRIRAWERQSPQREALPIVALTANARADDRDRCVAAGMDDYLPKPFTGDALAAMLRRNLRTSPARAWAKTALRV